MSFFLCHLCNTCFSMSKLDKIMIDGQVYMCSKQPDCSHHTHANIKRDVEIA